MFAPEALELRGSVFGNLGLDILDVALVKFGGLAILEDHKVGVFFCGEGKTSEDFEGRAGDTTLVGARVLEQDHLALLEMETGLLGEEQVGSLHDVLEVGLALRINQGSHIGDIDGLGTIMTRISNGKAIVKE